MSSKLLDSSNVVFIIYMQNQTKKETCQINSDLFSTESLNLVNLVISTIHLPLITNI